MGPLSKLQGAYSFPHEPAFVRTRVAGLRGDAIGGADGGYAGRLGRPSTVRFDPVPNPTHASKRQPARSGRTGGARPSGKRGAKVHASRTVPATSRSPVSTDAPPARAVALSCRGDCRAAENQPLEARGTPTLDVRQRAGEGCRPRDYGVGAVNAGRRAAKEVFEKDSIWIGCAEARTPCLVAKVRGK